MYTSANMGLKIWNLVTDLFSHTQLEGNFAEIDTHDHTTGNGVQIPTGGIANAAVTPAKVAATGSAGVSTYSSGTDAARPTAGQLGRVYYATDTGRWYQDNGSVWGPVLVANAWSPLTLNSTLSVPSGFATPSIRLEGDIVRFKGTFENTSGSVIAAGQYLFSIGSSTRYLSPSYPQPLPVVQWTTTSTAAVAGAWLYTNTNYYYYYNAVQIASNGYVTLDGATYTID